MLSKLLFSCLAVFVSVSFLAAQNNYQTAIEKKDIRTVQKSDVDVNAAFVSEGQRLTPLSYAAVRADAEMVSVLLKKGASAKTLVDGQDALMYAAKGGNKECVDLILAAGANVMNESKEGKTARDFAVQAGHTDIAIALEQAMQKVVDQAKAKRNKK
ncbi:MAG: ankyrin repeat domain-containing protein [Saprospiraceae bacterium]|nr:ankyrin repeat domain-containing protein [Candidatus Vicinibacter proximus]